MSPMGEPLARLPPMVPDARTCAEPKRRMISAKSGWTVTRGVMASASVRPAPSDSALSPASMAVKAPRKRPNQMIFCGVCSALVIHKPTSVAPDRISASGCSR